MKLPKIIHWIALASLGFYVVRSVVLFSLNGSLLDALTVGFWVLLSWMLFRRPKTWGLGLGIFWLLIIPIQFGLWRLALTHPNKAELGLSDSWLEFILSVMPLFIAGVCSISLRWLYAREPRPSGEPAIPMATSRVEPEPRRP